MAIRVTQKIISILIVLIGVSLVTFLFTYLAPGDAASVMLTQQGISPTQELLEATREKMGLNDPFVVQYGRWIVGILHLDFGESYQTGKNVAEMFFRAMPRTLALTGFSLVILVAVSFPLGILCAKYSDKALDNIVRVVSYLFNSLPQFFVALLMLYFLCLKLGWFNVVAKDDFSGMIMPALLLGVTLSAWYIRQIRSLALEQLNADYIKCLRARGVPERKVLGKHVLKNCLIPTITLLGVSFGGLLGGSAIVESIFGWRGVGQMVIEAISFRDYPVIQAYALWMAVIFLIVNYLVDITYHYIDPRTRRGKSS